VLILAGAVRLWGLTSYPPGLYPDQAVNGEDALEILAGKPQVFSFQNNGRESLFFYVQAATVGLFGIGAWQLFLGSAIVGTATVGLTYLAGARLFGAHGPALLAALFLATNPWHVTLSRTGFRAVMVPFCIVLALWLLARMLQARTPGSKGANAVFAGAAVGLTLYTYGAARAFVVFLGLCVVLALACAFFQPTFRPRIRQLVGPVALLGIVALLVSAPLAWTLLQHPEFFGARAQQVSIFNPDLNGGSPSRTFVRMVGRTFRAFVWDGDGNPRHNVPLPGLAYNPGGAHGYAGGGAPFLSLFPGLLAIGGIGVAVVRAPWLLLLFLVMLLPAVTTAEGMPHGLRTVGAIPSHVWLAGLGGAWLLDTIRREAWSIRLMGTFGVAALLLVTAVTDSWLYFVVAQRNPLSHYEYRADLTTVADYLTTRARARPGQQPPYLVLDGFSVQTVHFLTTKAQYPYVRVEPKDSALRSLAVGDEMVFVQSTLPDASRYLAAHPDVRILEDRSNVFGETVMLVLAPR
jgi:4-amino-4-deoxy-L-arabinose transferase-like glycosyltransferase